MEQDPSAARGSHNPAFYDVDEEALLENSFTIRDFFAATDTTQDAISSENTIIVGLDGNGDQVPVAGTKYLAFVDMVGYNIRTGEYEAMDLIGMEDQSYAMGIFIDWLKSQGTVITMDGSWLTKMRALKMAEFLGAPIRYQQALEAFPVSSPGLIDVPPGYFSLVEDMLKTLWKHESGKSSLVEVRRE